MPTGRFQRANCTATNLGTDPLKLSALVQLLISLLDQDLSSNSLIHDVKLLVRVVTGGTNFHNSLVVVEFVTGARCS